MALRVALLAAAVSATSGSSYSINSGSPGPIFDGIGAISGGGATSRLLFNYPPQQLGEILDFLFKPNFGLSLHLLKVEIGGDGQSSEGVEASHMHTQDDLNYNRGYEWRLMTEARKRNPKILISALAWAFPGWIGAGSSSPWTDPQLTVTYMVNWLKGARDVYNISVDFIDADMNERGWNAAFVKDLRTAMDTAGFQSTRIVCGDDAHTFACANTVRTDAALAKAVYALGSHNPGTDPNAVATGKPMWGTELEVSDPGGSDTATGFANLFINQNVTGFQFWNLLTAYYEGLFAWDQGQFRAYSPWSGNYELCGRVWVNAHITQNTEAGWRFLSKGVGSGALSSTGTYITWVDPATNALTIVVNKPAGSSTESATFTLTGPAASITKLNVWHSAVTRGDNPDLTPYYNAQPAIAVTGGSFTVSLKAGDLYTFTTVSTGSKGSAPAPPAIAPFPKKYSDNYDACPENAEPAYWTAQTGYWECVPSNGTRGMVMRQMVPMHPVAWRPDEQRPNAILGDIAWTDMDVSIDVNMPGAKDSVLIGARANPNCCGRIITGEDMMPGVWFQISAGTSQFYVHGSIQNVTKTNLALLSGTLPITPAAGTWYTLRLVTSGANAAGYINGQQAFTALRVSGRTPAAGFAGIGTENWGMFALWDNFTVTAT